MFRKVIVFGLFEMIQKKKKVRSASMGPGLNDGPLYVKVVFTCVCVYIYIYIYVYLKCVWKSNYIWIIRND